MPQNPNEAGNLNSQNCNQLLFLIA